MGGVCEKFREFENSYIVTHLKQKQTNKTKKQKKKGRQINIERSYSNIKKFHAGITACVSITRAELDQGSRVAEDQVWQPLHFSGMTTKAIVHGDFRVVWDSKLEVSIVTKAFPDNIVVVVVSSDTCDILFSRHLENP